MIKRLLAIAFIFICTSIAWLILGTTVMIRSGAAGDRLRGRVESIWGAPQAQSAPVAEYALPVIETEVVKGSGKQETVERTRYQTHTVRPSSSEIAVELQNSP